MDAVFPFGVSVSVPVTTSGDTKATTQPVPTAPPTRLLDVLRWQRTRESSSSWSDRSRWAPFAVDVVEVCEAMRRQSWLPSTQVSGSHYR